MLTGCELGTTISSDQATFARGSLVQAIRTLSASYPYIKSVHYDADGSLSETSLRDPEIIQDRVLRSALVELGSLVKQTFPREIAQLGPSGIREPSYTVLVCALAVAFPRLSKTVVL